MPLPLLSRLLAVALACWLCSGTCYADWPQTPPNDPDFRRCEDQVPPCSFIDEQWNLFSFEPSTAPGAGISGASVDIAWPITIGNSGVVIAITDSGAYWETDDLVNQAWLNRGELSPPQGADGNFTPGLYDRNGDGRFNIQDYREDVRAWDRNFNGKGDPQDLIRAFSDGIDDDGNGYIDDICGWDFMWNDNDPVDETRHQHGRNMALHAVAEANNGTGEVGVAPGASYVPLRIGDSFIVDINRWAEAVIYAADNNISVVSSSVGSVNNSSFARAAAAYAFRKGTLLVAAITDQNQVQHNYPATYPEPLALNAVTFDCEGLSTCTTTTFTSHNNCTNYGGRLDFAFPGTGCASEATSSTAGEVALIISRGIDLVQASILSAPLTPLEVKAILKNTADDIYQPHLTEVIAGQPGWDQYYGYGRANAFRAVNLIAPGTIPPEVMISGPDWFTTISPANGNFFRLTGQVAANRESGYSYRVEIAPGVEPLEEDFETLSLSLNHTVPLQGILAAIPLDRIPVEPLGPPSNYDQFSFTVRVRVTDSLGNTAEDRRNLFFHDDPSLKPGFPMRLGTSGDSSPVLVDFDQDGAAEIVLAKSDGSIAVYHGDGSFYPNFPVYTDIDPAFDPQVSANHLAAPAYRNGAVRPPREGIVSSPAVGDIDGDGLREIVLGGLRGKLYIFKETGAVQPGFPVSLERGLQSQPYRYNEWDYGMGSSPSLWDLDRDGKLEIICGAQDQYVHVWRWDGSVLSGWPRRAKSTTVGKRIVASTAVGDLDKDGFAEIYVGSAEYTNGSY